MSTLYQLVELCSVYYQLHLHVLWTKHIQASKVNKASFALNYEQFPLSLAQSHSNHKIKPGVTQWTACSTISWL